MESALVSGHMQCNNRYLVLPTLLLDCRQITIHYVHHCTQRMFVMKSVVIPVPLKPSSVPLDSTVSRDTTPTIALEGRLRLYSRDTVTQPDTGLIVLHPYSLLGGSMNDAIVTEVMRQSQALKYFGAVLCYNMRGVGGSEGNKMSVRNLFGSGQEDASDVHHVIDWLVDRMQEVNTGSEKHIALVGYSFGAALAAQAIEHARVSAYAGISVPIGTLASSLLRTRTYCNSLFCSDKRKLILVGDQDQYTSIQQLERMLASHVGTNHGSVSLQQAGTALGIRVHVFENNDHFWGNDHALMVETLMAWLVEQT